MPCLLCVIYFLHVTYTKLSVRHGHGSPGDCATDPVASRTPLGAFGKRQEEFLLTPGRKDRQCMHERGIFPPS